MPLKRRISTLKLIKRVKQHEIDAQAVKVAAIHAAQSKLESELDELQLRVETEARVMSPEGAPFLASFLRAIEKRRAFLLAQLKVLDEEAQEIEEQIREAFLEAKANDAVLANSDRQLRFENEKREIAAYEEIANNLYLRARL